MATGNGDGHDDSDVDGATEDNDGQRDDHDAGVDGEPSAENGGGDDATTAGVTDQEPDLERDDPPDAELDAVEPVTTSDDGEGVDGSFDDGDEPTFDEVSSDERTWGILVHASAFVGLVFPMGHLLVPLLIWLIKRDESDFVDANGMEAVNFQLSMTIYVLVSVILIVLLIGLVLVPLLAVVWFALVILASIRASEGEVYRYPATIRFIS